MTEQLNNEIANEEVLDVSDYTAVEADIAELAQTYQDFSDAEKKNQTGKKTAGDSIKDLLSAHSLTKVESESFTVQLQERTRSSMNEDKLLNTLKELGLTKCIRTVEKVDSDALEAIIYAGELEPDAIAHCEDSSTSYVLSVRKKKAKPAKSALSKKVVK